MKLRFYYDRFDMLAIEADGKYQFLAWVLTDNNHDGSINELLDVLAGINTSDEEWDASFNKSYININSSRVRCGDLFNENEFIDIDNGKFVSTLKKWKIFIAKNGKSREQVLFI